jgi:hypothetical protein
MINALRTCHDHPILDVLVIYVLQTCRDYSLELFMINVLRTCHDHPILDVLVIYVLQTCRDYSLELFMINVLRTCHDHLIFVRIIFNNSYAANMP